MKVLYVKNPAKLWEIVRKHSCGHPSFTTKPDEIVFHCSHCLTEYFCTKEDLDNFRLALEKSNLQHQFIAEKLETSQGRLYLIKKLTHHLKKN